ncbi:MAG: GNAT family N-acetyltransferase, partial [Natronosporangium sp.]
NPDHPTGIRVRPITADDLDAAADRWLEEVRWDAQFGSATERPSTLGAVRRELTGLVARDQPWTWVTETAAGTTAGTTGGELTGLVVVSPPDRAEWIANLTCAAPVAYLSCLVVSAGRRGGGVGAALVRQAHAALDAAGVNVTLLHYAALNPLSGPFWHRCGYRPLWTIWHARPASELR